MKLFVTGPPGVGKTTYGRKLSIKEHLHLVELDAFLPDNHVIPLRVISLMTDRVSDIIAVGVMRNWKEWIIHPSWSKVIVLLRDPEQVGISGHKRDLDENRNQVLSKKKLTKWAKDWYDYEYPSSVTVTHL